MTKPFSEVLAEMQAMHDKKSQDYGVQADPFANVRASEDFGIPGWLGTVVRLNDKITRIKSFAKNGSLANESLRDSLIDIAVYAAIAVALYDQKVAEKPASYGSMAGKALAQREAERFQFYPKGIVPDTSPYSNTLVAKHSGEAVAYGCVGDCENCTCHDCADESPEDSVMIDPLGVDPSQQWCASTYYHNGGDNKCELPEGHEGAHENWATAGVNGPVLQWSGKASVAT